ncbi:MAG: GNAT family N-acetyltransferase [Candidatus Coatesbacteria bacterium]|nr:MAG: GNAT family N-acetyltransferase [Candidatus Coatesbacteria bacterium]
MNKEGFELVEREPTVNEYQRFRRAVGWSEVAGEGVEVGLKNALYYVVLFHDKKTIGCGRVVGDGGIYFYVQDIIVLPEYQGLGLGRSIMDKVMDYLRRRAKAGAFIGLMAAEGVAPFYERYGFEVRPDDAPGMAMRWEG